MSLYAKLTLYCPEFQKLSQSDFNSIIESNSKKAVLAKHKILQVLEKRTATKHEVGILMDKQQFIRTLGDLIEVVKKQKRRSGTNSKEDIGTLERSESAATLTSNKPFLQLETSVKGQTKENRAVSKSINGSCVQAVHRGNSDSDAVESEILKAKITELQSVIDSNPSLYKLQIQTDQIKILNRQLDIYSKQVEERSDKNEQIIKELKSLKVEPSQERKIRIIIQELKRRHQTLEPDPPKQENDGAFTELENQLLKLFKNTNHENICKTHKMLIEIIPRLSPLKNVDYKKQVEVLKIEIENMEAAAKIVKQQVENSEKALRTIINQQNEELLVHEKQLAKFRRTVEEILKKSFNLEWNEIAVKNFFTNLQEKLEDLIQ